MKRLSLIITHRSLLKRYTHAKQRISLKKGKKKGFLTDASCSKPGKTCCWCARGPCICWCEHNVCSITRETRCCCYLLCTSPFRGTFKDVSMECKMCTATCSVLLSSVREYVMCGSLCNSHKVSAHRPAETHGSVACDNCVLSVCAAETLSDTCSASPAR